MADRKDELKHKVVMEERAHLIITGVRKVKSFDTKEIVLDTVKGGLVIKGHELGVKNLDLDQTEVEIEGSVDSFTYSSGKGGGNTKGVWERVFK